MRASLLLACVAALCAAGVVWLLVRGEAAPRRGPGGTEAVAGADRPAAPEPPKPPQETAAALPVRTSGLVQDEERRPIPGAEVESRVWDGSGYAAADRATSGPDGRFSVGSPASTFLTLVATHPDYVRASVYTRSAESDVTITMRRGARLVVVAVSPDLVPVAGAKVRAQSVDDRWEWVRSEEIGAGATDAQGRIALGAAPEGTIRVEVDHPDYAKATDEFRVAGREPVERRIVLDRGGAVAGRVVDPAGKPVDGATVFVWGAPTRSARTDAGGNYLLSAVAQGETRIGASAKGFAPGFFGESMGWGEPVPIPVKSGQTIRGIDIELNVASFVRGRALGPDGAPLAGATVVAQVFRRGGTDDTRAESDASGVFVIGPLGARHGATGQVTLRFPGLGFPESPSFVVKRGETSDVGDVRARALGTIRGRVLDERGEPLREGAVRAASSFAPIRSDGSFELRSVPAGDVFLSVQLPGSRVWMRHPTPVRLAEGATVDGVEIRLDAPLAISGRVVTDKGAPRPSIGLIAAPAELQPPYESAVLAWAASDEKGEFRLEGLREGVYRVGLLGPWKEGKRFFRESPTPVEVRAGAKEVEFVVPVKGGFVRGRVLRHDGTAATALTLVSHRYSMFFPTSESWQGLSDLEDGKFLCEIDEPGTWAVEVRVPGAAPLTTDTFKLAEGETKDLGELRLGKGGTIRGKVRDAAGRPVPFTRINVLSPKFETNDDAPFTDLDGEFRLEGVAPGVYNVFAVSPQHPLGILRALRVEELGDHRVEIRFPPPCPLLVVVRDENGRPLPGVELSYTSEVVMNLPSKLFRQYEPPGYGEHRTNADGEISKPCFPPGDVRVTLELEGFQPETRSIRLQNAEPNRLEVVLKRAK